MKNFLLLISCIFFTSISIAQTNISGIINDYAAVTSLSLNACNSIDLTVDNASAFNVGDTILIIQMQGSTIDLSNTASFGDITSQGNAGSLEKNVIKSIAGNVITLKDTIYSNTPYDVAGKVQIVSIPYYVGDVNVNATLTAANWDGDKGGVLIFETNGVLTLNADIDLIGRGFRGGGTLASGTSGESCDFFGSPINGCVGIDYFYNNTSNFAVEKGEGVSILTNAFLKGKGKNANGGGGGGIEAGGGGGGASLGAGGSGGGCNENSCSSAFGCNCANVSIVSGLGGDNLPLSAGLLYLGGGSGAGNNGNSSQYYGTPHSVGLNGGGIAIIEASSIVGNNNSINTSGADGVDLSASGVGTMGTSGGGGGGSIFLNATTYTNLNVTSNGGRGNDSRKTSGSADATGGSGGGGGGGLVTFGNPGIPLGVTVSFVGGVAGNCYDREGDLRSGLFRGSNGSNGNQIANFPIPVGPEVLINPGFVNPLTVCETNDFTILSTNDAGNISYNYQWQIDSNGVWQNLLNSATYQNVTTIELNILNAQVEMSDYTYRIFVYNSCGDTAISNDTSMTVIPLAEITLDPVSVTSCLGGSALFFADAIGATSYQWQRLSGGWQNLTDNANYSGTNTDSLTITNIDATFSNSFYRLLAFNSCGNDFSTIAILSLASQPIIIDDQSSDLQVCIGTDSLLYYTSSSTIDAIQWQVNEGSGFVDLSNNGDYQGVTNDTLQLIGISATEDGDIFRALLSNTCGDLDTVENILLNVNPPPSVSLSDTQLVCEGLGVFVSIANIVGTNITYQWQIDSSGTWENLTNTNGYSNVTGSFLGFDQSIVVPSITSNFYRVVINTDCGPATSNPFVLDVSANPVITQQAENDTICLGEDVTFTVTTSGASSFQWQSNASGSFQDLANNAVFSGVNSNTLTITSVTSTEASADYRIVLAADLPCTDAISDTVSIIVPASPVLITAQSASFTICEGLDTFLFVSTSDAVSSYQWSINPGAPVNLTNNPPFTGTQSDTLFITPADFSIDGMEFFCTMVDYCGISVQTIPVEITVTPGLLLANQPDSLTVCLGEDVEFIVEAIGSNVLYQWQEFNGVSWSDLINGGAISGATTDTLAISNVQSILNGNLYRALIIDDCGVADTTIAALLVNSVIDITAQSGDMTVCPGDDTLFYFTSNLTAESIQWQLFDGLNFIDLNNDLNYSGVANDSLVLSNIPFTFDGNIYRAYAIDSCGFSDTTTLINLTVNVNILVTDEPVNQIICEGDSTGFAISASGNPSAYQWQVNQGGLFVNVVDDTNYTGAQTDTLILSNIPSSFNGNTYQCIITSICNSDTSTIALLTVNSNVLSTENVTICADDSLVLSDGSSVNSTGSFQDTISNGALNGCDSIITYNLTVNPLSFSNETTILCFGDSLELSDGSFIKSTGSFQDTIANGSATNCDSIHTINLTVLPLATSNLNPTLCFGDSFELSDGSFESTSGIYNDTLFASTPNMCDSIVVIDLIISPLVTENVSEIICSNDSLVLSDGSSVNTTGIYNDTLVNASTDGCDSIVIYDLTVNPVANGSNPQTICLGESYTLPGGASVNTAGIYLDTLNAQATNGCDSIVSTNLTILPVPSFTLVDSFCSGYNYTLPSGTIVTNGGIYPDTLTNAAFNGCDSIVVVDLFENSSPALSNETTILCFGDSLELSDGSFVHSNGIYNDTIASGSANGCDSINVIDLTILPLATSNLNPTLCFGDSFELSDGSFESTSGIYNDTLFASTPNMCDSIVVIDLTISPLVTENVSEIICSNDSLVLSNGSSVNTTGIYNDTLVNASTDGCDSIVIYDLTVNPVANGSNPQTICSGESYTLPGGASVNTTGIYLDTLIAQATNGCDSIVSTNLTVLPVPSFTLVDSFCSGYNYTLPSGTIVTNGGVYPDTLTNAASNGCDSIVVVDLFENSSPALSNETTILCFGDSLELSDGSFVHSNGIYNDTIASGSANGCDSINVIDLTILPLATSNLNPTLCFGDSFELSDGSFVNSTGIYNDTLFAITANLCDSIVIIDLTISAPIASSISPVLCFGDSFQLSDGSFINTTGSYQDTLVNGSNSGCDSIVTIGLTVLPLSQENQNVTICSNDSLVLSDGTTVNITGVYNDTLTNGSMDGCDSIVIYNLTVNPVANGSNPQTICAGDSYTLPGGDIVSTTGIYNDTLINAAINGCDSIVQTNLNVLPVSTFTINDNFCSGTSYTLASGSMVDSTGIYQDTLVNGAANNCDSIITYNLTEDALPAAVNVLDTICFNENYTLPDGSLVSASGIYIDTITASDGCDSLVQTNLFVLPANLVLDQSQSLVLCAEDDALFYVTSQQTNVTYEWFNSGTPMINSNNDTMILPNISAGNSGNIFQVQVYGVCDTVFSNAVLLTVRPNATITSNPADVEVCEGSSASFTVTTNIPVASYEWFENGVAIANSNAATHTIAAVTLAQSGNQYTCMITDSCSVQTTSTAATLTVNPNLQVGFQSNSQTGCVNTDALFFVNVTAGSNVSYQWFLNGSALAGEINDSLSLVNLTAAMDNNSYTVEITSDCGNQTSNPMVLNVIEESVLLSQSEDLTQCAGFSFDLFVDATDIQTYQWQINEGAGFVNLMDGDFNGTATQVNGATSSNLTISNYEESISGSVFQVILTNSCGIAPVYTPVTVTITSPIEITDPVEDVYTCLREIEPITLPYVTSNGTWSNGDFGSTFIPTETGVYTVDFIDANNCPNSDDIFVEIEDCVASCYVTAPTGFSPNGSQANDVFRAIYGCDLSFFELVVYNRWGELVFITNDPDGFWDGNYKGIKAEIGVYAWYIQYQKEGADEKEAIKGNVTLIR